MNKQREKKSFDEWLEIYSEWKKELLTIAINQFEYKEDVITEKLNDGDYLQYFKEEETPFNTLQLCERDGL